LQQLQSKYKLTWVPDKAVERCMACRGQFRMFGGKSKHHCRFCGRVFCRECCSQSTLPEFGYSGKVLVCKPCFEFKHKKAAEDEDDD